MCLGKKGSWAKGEDTMIIGQAHVNQCGSVCPWWSRRYSPSLVATFFLWLLTHTEQLDLGVLQASKQASVKDNN